MTTDHGTPIEPVRATRSGALPGRLIFGMALLVLGAMWTADNLGLVDADAVLRWWPALLLGYGLLSLVGAFGTRKLVSGSIFMVIGGWMLARELGWIQVSIFRMWPLFLIFIGASLVWRSMSVGRAAESGGLGAGPNPWGFSGGSENASFPRPFAFMGGVERNIESRELVGIEATAVMGGVVLDLRNARARGPEVVVEAFTWWGGIDLIVPQDWQVVAEVSPIMGGVEDKTRNSGDPNATRLVVRGMVVMGGIELRNKSGDDRAGEGKR